MPSAHPSAPRLDLVDDVFGTAVADPYRWLEDPHSEQTRAWSAAQDARCAPLLAAAPGRGALHARLAELVPGEIGPPHVVGDRSFFLQRLPGEDHAVLWVEVAGVRRALVDPNALSEDHTLTLDGWSASLEGDRLAYLVSEGGDEESVLRVMDVATGVAIDGPIDRARYSSLAWLPGGDALYYVRRLPPGDVPAGEAQYHRRVYLHRVGADPSTDRLVFGDGIDKTAYFELETSMDGRWLAVAVSLGTAPRNDLHLADLAGPGGSGRPTWRAALVGVDAHAWPLFGRDGRLLVLTDLGAPRRRLVTVAPEAPEPAGWVDLLAEDPSGAVLDGAVLAGDAIVATRRRHAVTEVALHDRATGALRQVVELPGLGSAHVAGRSDEGAEAWITYTDHVTPPRVLHLDAATGAVAPWADPPGWDPACVAADLTSRQVVFRSADGTEVRMFVIAAAGDPRTPRPTILYGYGGFNIALTPGFSASILAWVGAGGVYAVANLRGGSEEGEAWHRDGMREHKQHVFDDFAAAAEWLVAEGWTTPAQLAISGGSNGGLLVGAALTQRPELYRAVVCSAPLLDMVRYERFGLGETWNDEYGTASDPAELAWLLGYSPYHHVVAGTAYPAVLFTVFDGDTRVDPLHARKMCAALQWATASDPDERPVVIRREADVGHGARAVSRTLDLLADELAWLAGQVGLELPSC